MPKLKTNLNLLEHLHALDALFGVCLAINAGIIGKAKSSAQCGLLAYDHSKSYKFINK
jgi:hypothetical protein